MTTEQSYYYALLNIIIGTFKNLDYCYYDVKAG